VDVERRVHRLERLEDREVLELVDVVPLEVRVEHRTVELERAHRALDLLDRTLHVARIERGAGREAVRMPAAGIGGEVVGLARERGAFGLAHHLHPRRGEQQQLPVDAVLVHVAEPQLAEILHHLLQGRHLREHRRHPQRVVARRLAAVEVFDLRLDQRRKGPRLLGGDALVRHVAVDVPRARRHAHARAVAEVFPEVALEALFAAVFEEGHQNIPFSFLKVSGSGIGWITSQCSTR
jgi:hypothetical protein